MSEEKKTEALADVEEEKTLDVKRPQCIFDKITTSFYAITCFVMSMLLMVVITAATLARYIFEMDLYGYEEWVKIFAFWLYFMGSAYGAYAGTHISADLITAYLKDGVFKRSLVFIKCLITFGVSLLFTKYGWDYFIFGYMGPLGTGIAIPRTVAWRIPLWTAYLSIFLGLLSMSYYFLRDTIRAGKALFGGKD